MAAYLLLTFLAALFSLVVNALPTTQKADTNTTFFNPLDRNGSFFASFDPKDQGPGEPLNVSIMVSFTQSPHNTKQYTCR